MQRYTSVTIDPHPLAPAALLLQELRGWLPQSVGTDDGLTRPAVIVGVVGVVVMAWALALVVAQIAPGLGDAIMAAIMSISFLLAAVCADRSRTGLGATRSPVTCSPPSSGRLWRVHSHPGSPMCWACLRSLSYPSWLPSGNHPHPRQTFRPAASRSPPV